MFDGAPKELQVVNCFQILYIRSLNTMLRHVEEALYML